MFWRPIPIALIVREQGKMFCVHVKKRDGAAALFAVTDIHDEKEATDKFWMEPYSYDDLSKGHVIRCGDLFVSSEEATTGDKSQGTRHTLVATTNRDKAKRVFPKQTAHGLTMTDEKGHLLTCDGQSLTFQKLSAGGRRLVESDTPGIFAQDFATWRSPDRILEGHKRLVMAAKLSGKRYSIGIINGKLAVDGSPHFWTVETGDAATIASTGVRLCLDSRYLTRTDSDLGLTASAAEATRFDFIIPREGQGFNVRVAGTGLVITFKADSQTPVLAPAQENPDERIAQRFLRETPYALLFSANNNEARAMAHDGSRVFAPLFGSGNVHNYLWLWDGDQIMAYDSWRPLTRQKGNPIKLELAPTPGFGTRWHVTPPGNIVTADDPAMSVIHSDYYSNEDEKIFLREFSPHDAYDNQQWRWRPYRETPMSTDMFRSAIHADEKFVLFRHHGRGLLTAPPVGSSDLLQAETWVAAPSPSQVWTHRDGVLVTDGERALAIVDGEPQVSNSQDAHRHKWNLSRDGILSDKSSGEKVLTSGLRYYNPNAVFIKKHDPLNYYDHRWILAPVKSLRPVSSQVILPTKVAGLALAMPAYFSSLSLKASGELVFMAFKAGGTGTLAWGMLQSRPLSSAVKTDESVNLGSNPVAIPHGNSFLLYYFGFESEGRNAPRILFCRDFSGPDKRVRPVKSHLDADLHDAGEISVVADAPGGRALFVLDSWTASYPRMISVTYTGNQPYYDEGGDLPINGYKTVFRPAGNLDDPLGSIIYFKEVAYAIRINCKSFQWSRFTGGKWGALKSITLPDEIWQSCQPSVVNLGDRLLVTFASHSQSGDPYERYLYMIAFHPEKEIISGVFQVGGMGLAGRQPKTILVNEQLILAVSNRDDRGRLASFDIKDLPR